MGKLLTIAAALLTLTSGMHAQNPVPQLPQPDARKVFRSAASMVALSVTVTDGARLVTGLRAADFQVLEDGVPQEVSFFDSSAVPMDVILLLDTSSSMRDRMPVVHEAAKGFMRILRPGDRGAVVAFDDRVSVLQDLTTDWSAIQAAIGSSAAKGATALHDAVYIALKQFGRTARGRGEVRRQAIALLSDGADTSSLISLDDVVGIARRMGVSIYSIGLQPASRTGQGGGESVQFSAAAYALKTLARETGAQAFFPSTVHELKDVYGAIAAELDAQYSLAYSPTDTRADGRFRRITVRVPVNPAFRPRTRLGYTADRATAPAEMSPLLR